MQTYANVPTSIKTVFVEQALFIMEQRIKLCQITVTISKSNTSFSLLYYFFNAIFTVKNWY